MDPHRDLSFEKAAPGERRALVFCSLLEPLDLEHASSSIGGTSNHLKD